MFDPILRKFATSFESVDLRYRHRFVSAEQSGNKVNVEIEDLENRHSLNMDAQYLIGCDGAGSAVRASVGIEMEGNPALTYTTNVIFRRDGFEALHGRKPGYRFIFLGPEGTWATLVAINGNDQWRFSIVRSSDRPRELTEEEVRAAIREMAGIDFDYEILSVLPWTRRQLVAERYRDKRIFLVGDAAHSMSPTGGFGMNTGIGEAVDLSWKLAAVLDGWGGDALLGSYNAERRPIAIRNVTEASGNLGRMLSADNMGRLLDRTELGDIARKEIGREFSERMTREWRTLGIHLGYRYEGSPICVPDGTEAPPDDPSEYVQTARPGSRAPHIPLADGRSTLDLFGKSFVLLVLGDDVPDTAPLVEAARGCKMPFEVVHVAEDAVTKAYENALVLVRPDGHVAWRGDRMPERPGQIIDTVRGA